MLAHNSATAYGAGRSLDEAAVCTDTAAWDDRADLATVRRGEQAAVASPEDWPAILATEEVGGPIEGNLVEVVLRRGMRPLAEIATIRLSQADHDALADKLGRAVEGDVDVISEDVSAFARLLNMEAAGCLLLEVVR